MFTRVFSIQFDVSSYHHGAAAHRQIRLRQVASPLYICPIVSFQHIHQSFDGFSVLSDISFRVKEGETLCLIGPSGSGKSTILKLINGLLLPDSGSVEIFGKSSANTDGVELRRKIGFVLQQPALFPHYTVKQNIEVVPNLLGWDKRKSADRTAELLELMALDPKEMAARYPSQLSGGQQQRVGIARALAADPELILFDEPFSALDPITRNDLQDELLRLKQHLRKTIVFVTHDICEAFKMGDSVLILHNGRVEQSGTPAEISAAPATDFVKQFIQSSYA